MNLTSDANEGEYGDKNEAKKIETKSKPSLDGQLEKPRSSVIVLKEWKQEIKVNFPI